MLCLPDWWCEAIGRDGLPEGRMIRVVKNGGVGMSWRRIEHCLARQAILAGREEN